MPLKDFRSVFMPYVVQQQPDGRYAVLNREYKPLGFVTRSMLDYGKFPVLVSMRITPATARKVSYSGSDDVKQIFLYNDGCIPTRSAKAMKEYLARVEALMQLKVKWAELD